MKNKLKKIRETPGHYEPNGEGWTVTLEDGAYYDCEGQDAAEIVSRLVELKIMLKENDKLDEKKSKLKVLGKDPPYLTWDGHLTLMCKRANSDHYRQSLLEAAEEIKKTYTTADHKIPCNDKGCWPTEMYKKLRISAGVEA